MAEVFQGKPEVQIEMKIIKRASHGGGGWRSSAGDDTFVFQAGEGNDTITNFGHIDRLWRIAATNCCRSPAGTVHCRSNAKA